MIKVGSDFSGVGAFDQALIRLGVDYKTVYACDMDKYARQTFIANYGEPGYYPENVYDREIPQESLDIYMTSPPCQSFSLAGKRKGETDKRGVLFYNSHEFIKENNPRYFIFENVKGLLSDDGGKTFQKWLDMLGGKSVNGNVVIFPHEDSVPYHIYHKVLNAKKYGVPQNRERIFIVGIRDDADNNFTWSKEIPLNKRLKDILENPVDQKYYLSEKAVKSLIQNPDNLQKTKVNPEIASTLQSPGNACGNYKGMNAIIGAIIGRGPNNNQELEIGSKTESNSSTTVQKDNILIESGTWRTHNESKGFRKIQDGNCPTIPARAREDGSGQPVIKIDYKIRRLTPRECFRLMDFPEEFIMPCSDTQMYKQAGNSIVVACLVSIIEKLNLK